MTVHGREIRPTDKGIKCPSCGHQTSTVKDSRPTDDFRQIRRRRLCLRCGARHTTFEAYTLSEQDRDALERGANLQRALEVMPQNQRRLIESLVFDIAAATSRPDDTSN
jgi:transcriptional regulator NrdR family protein